MLGSRSGWVALVKQKQTSVRETHCIIHRETLASNTLPKNFQANLVVIINIVNYVKGSVLNTRLFRELCKDMTPNTLFFYFIHKFEGCRKEIYLCSTTAPNIEALISNKQSAIPLSIVVVVVVVVVVEGDRKVEVKIRVDKRNSKGWMKNDRK